MKLCCLLNGQRVYTCRRCKQQLCVTCGPQRKRIPNDRYEEAKALLRKLKVASYKDDRMDGKSIKPKIGVFPGQERKEIVKKLYALQDSLPGSCGYRYFFYMPLVCDECYEQTIPAMPS
jgi:hypothetical protein